LEKTSATASAGAASLAPASNFISQWVGKVRQDGMNELIELLAHCCYKEWQELSEAATSQAASGEPQSKETCATRQILLQAIKVVLGAPINVVRSEHLKVALSELMSDEERAMRASAMHRLKVWCEETTADCPLKHYSKIHGLMDEIGNSQIPPDVLEGLFQFTERLRQKMAGYVIDLAAGQDWGASAEPVFEKVISVLTARAECKAYFDSKGLGIEVIQVVFDMTRNGLGMREAFRALQSKVSSATASMSERKEATIMLYQEFAVDARAAAERIQGHFGSEPWVTLINTALRQDKGLARQLLNEQSKALVEKHLQDVTNPKDRSIN